MPIPAREPIVVIGDIITSRLSLTSSQIILTNQKYNLPADPGLHIALSSISSRAIGSNTFFRSTVTGLEEVNQVALQEVVQIDMFSQDSSARTRRVEVIAALNSIYAQQLCELYAMSMSRLPTDFVDVSSLEATANLNRFTANITVKSLYEKVLTSTYYDKFPTDSTNRPEIHHNA